MTIFTLQKKISKMFKPRLLFIAFCLSFILAGCSDPEYTLEYSGPSPGAGDAVYPKTPIGQQIKEHVTAMSAVGVDAESNYQKSLAKMRSTPGVTTELMQVFDALPEEDYFRRTLLVEALKEMQTEEALTHLERIAYLPIPKDRMPDNTEVNTREREIVIRITAVQGLSVLATQKSSKSNDLLLDLVKHEDLTVRQMAARGYLASAFGNKEEKIQQLMQVVPRNEHWYLTTERTEIRKVDHPDVLPDLNLEEFLKRRSDKAPKTGDVK